MNKDVSNNPPLPSGSINHKEEREISKNEELDANKINEDLILSEFETILKNQEVFTEQIIPLAPISGDEGIEVEFFQEMNILENQIVKKIYEYVSSEKKMKKKTSNPNEGYSIDANRYVNIYPKFINFWRNYKANLFARSIQSEQDIFEGTLDFKNINDFDIYSRIKDTEYIGQWKKNKPHGKGVEKWPDGALYEGYFSNGIKKGIGKFTWIDNSTYQGEF